MLVKCIDTCFRKTSVQQSPQMWSAFVSKKYVP